MFYPPEVFGETSSEGVHLTHLYVVLVQERVSGVSKAQEVTDVFEILKNALSPGGSLRKLLPRAPLNPSFYFIGVGGVLRVSKTTAVTGLFAILKKFYPP